MTSNRENGNKPLVSIIIPTFNSGRYLDLSLESICRQTYSNLEIIAIDDASSDDTYNKLVEWQKKNGSIRLYKNEGNLGIAKTRNKGVSLANGKYIALMDHDDISRPTRIEKEVDFLENNGEYAAVGTQIDVIDEQGTVVGKKEYKTTFEKIMHELPFASPICNPSAMIRTSALKEIGPYDETLSGSEDYEMWFKMAGKYKLANINEYLFAYRVSNSQTSTKDIHKMVTLTQRVQGRWIFKKEHFNLKAILIFFARPIAYLVPNKILAAKYKAGYCNLVKRSNIYPII